MCPSEDKNIFHEIFKELANSDRGKKKKISQPWSGCHINEITGGQDFVVVCYCGWIQIQVELWKWSLIVFHLCLALTGFPESPE